MFIDKLNQSGLSRRDFFKLGSYVVAFLSGLNLNGCSSVENEPKPLQLVPPLTITYLNSSLPNYRFSKENWQAFLTNLENLGPKLQSLPLASINLTAAPYQFEPPILPKERALCRVEYFSNGAMVFRIDNGLTTSQLHYPSLLLVPEVERISSFGNSVYNRLDANLGKVIQTASRNISYASDLDYGKYFQKETTSYHITTGADHQPTINPIFPPGCRKFNEEFQNSNLVNPTEYSLAPVHDPQTALTVLKSLLVLSERGQLLSSGVDNIEKLELYHQNQPMEAIATLRDDVFATVGSYVEDTLGNELLGLEASFTNTLSRLPEELPVAYRILEEKINEKGEKEERTRVVFLDNDKTTENWFNPKDLADSFKNSRSVEKEQLPPEFISALNLDNDGFTTLSIEDAPCGLYWTGEEYTVGVSVGNQVILEMNQTGPKLLKQIKGVNTGELDAEKFKDEVSDLTAWYYDLKAHGVDWVGPAGLTIPEWLSRVIWGMEPRDSGLAASLSKANYFWPLFKDSALAQLEELSSDLILYRGTNSGQLQVYDAKQHFLLDPLLSIQGFSGTVLPGDFLPVYHKDALSLVGVNPPSAISLVIGKNITDFMALPYYSGQFAVIRGKCLRDMSSLMSNLERIYASEPKFPEPYRNKIRAYSSQEKKERRQYLSEVLDQTPQL